MSIKQLTTLSLIIITTSLLSGCASPEKIAARKAQKEENARQGEMSLLAKVREKFPCDTGKVLQGRTVYLTGDSIPYPVIVQGKEVIRYVQCPPSKFRVDTLPIIDRAALQASRDSTLSALFTAHQLEDGILDLNKENASLREDNEGLKSFKGWMIGILISLSIGVIAIVIIKNKIL